MTQRRPGPRPAVVGTCSLSTRGLRDPQQLLDNGRAMVEEMVRQAGQQGWSLDLAVLPETFADVETVPAAQAAQALDGPIVRAMAAVARAHRAYVVAPLRLRLDGRVHNSAVLLDRAGEPLGVYHKARPVVLPDGTLEGGTTPGTCFPVFDLDFGHLGVQICFDVCYDEGWEALAAQEAELVVFPTAAPTVSALVGFGWRYGYYIVASALRPPSLIVDPLGCPVARAEADRQATVVRVDLDYRVLPSRFIWTRGPEVRQRYGERLDFGWHDAEGACLLTSRDPELPIGRLVEQEGLETMRQFLERNRQAQEEARGR
ncbi:MAG: carbon-nitrogen hydrolase family protein [Candidatus Latescibacterota bacterium]